MLSAECGPPTGRAVPAVSPSLGGVCHAVGALLAEVSARGPGKPGPDSTTGRPSLPMHPLLAALYVATLQFAAGSLVATVLTDWRPR